jgi:hypothetical protein
MGGTEALRGRHGEVCWIRLLAEPEAMNADRRPSEGYGKSVPARRLALARNGHLLVVSQDGSGFRAPGRVVVTCQLSGRSGTVTAPMSARPASGPPLEHRGPEDKMVVLTSSQPVGRVSRLT